MKKVMLASAFGLLLALGTAQAQVVVRIGPPPPPPREVVVVSPGPRYVWVPGYYRYHGHGYVWVSGHYVSPAASLCGMGAGALGPAPGRLRLDKGLLEVRPRL